jgi:two-component system response regulator NreC
MNIRILLADDHAIIRQGLRSLLAAQSGMEVVAEAEDGRATVQLVRTHHPDVVLMDVQMPDLNGVEAARQVMAVSPRTKVLALSMHDDGRFVERMLAAGAAGYLLKDCAFEEVVRAIRTVVDNQTYLSPKIAGVLVDNFVRRPAQVAPPLLTPREREVLQLMAEGRSTKETASILDVSVKTIETHRQQIMAKLDIHSVAELTKYAVREGLTSLEP